MLQRLPMLMSISQFFEWASHAVYSNHKCVQWNIEMSTYRSNFKISSYFSLWKLDYFFNMAFLRKVFDTRNMLDDKTFMVFLLNPANHSEFFSVISKPDMEPGCILLKIKPIPIREIPTKALPVWVFYIIEKVCVCQSLKTVVAMLQSSGLRLKHGNIASIKTKHATKFCGLCIHGTIHIVHTLK